MLTKRILATSMLLAIVSHAHSGQQIDQDHLVTTSFPSGGGVATIQTFAQVVTVGVSGTLSQVDVQIWASPGISGSDVTFRIVSATEGVPGSLPDSELFSSIIALGDIPTSSGFPDPDTLPLTSIDLSKEGLTFSEGDQFAIVLERTGPGAPPWVLWGGTFDSYTGGQAFLTDGSPLWSGSVGDRGFRTWMIPDGTGSCLEDLDGNGEIGFGDLLLLLDAWGRCT